MTNFCSVMIVTEVTTCTASPHHWTLPQKDHGAAHSVSPSFTKSKSSMNYIELDNLVTHEEMLWMRGIGNLLTCSMVALFDDLYFKF